MENNNDNEECDQLMEKYNFDSPIEVTLVIQEEEDPPAPSSLKDLLLLKSNYLPFSNNVCSRSSEVFKKSLNIDNVNNKRPIAKENYNTKTLVEQNDRSISVNKPVLPKGPQKEIKDFPWPLLDTVADHLIHITKCYYYNFINNKKEVRDYEKLKSEYLTFKQNFFNLSYSTTVAVLLPHENNITFLHHFIYRIIKIANHSSWYEISYKKLELLIREMLIWTKQKKKYLDARLGSFYHERSGIYRSSNALTINNRLNYSMQGTNGQPDIVREAQLPTQAMNTSPNTYHKSIITFPTQEIISALNITSKTSYLVQNLTIPTSNDHISNISERARTEWNNNDPKTLHLLQETNISPNRVPKTNPSDKEKGRVFNIETNNSTEGVSHLPYTCSRINHSTEAITSIYNNDPKTNNLNSYQAMNTNMNKVLLSTGPPNQEITISINPLVLANINQIEKHNLDNNATKDNVNVQCGNQSNKRRKINDNNDCNLNSTPCHNENNSNYQIKNCPATTYQFYNEFFYDDTKQNDHKLGNTNTIWSSIS